MIKPTIVFLLFIQGLFSSCKRYEEDPITLRTPENRIRRNWHLQSFTLNGADSMAFLVRNELAGTWTFGPRKSSSGSYFEINRAQEALWQLDKDGDDIMICCISINDSWISSMGLFTIIKLTTKELKMQHRRSGAIIYFRSHN